MSTREHFLKVFGDEKPKFIRVLKAVPADQPAYTPHPRSMSAGDIVWLLASELNDAAEVMDHGEVNFVIKPAPGSLTDSVAAYEKNSEALSTRLEAVSDEAWEKPVKFLMDGKAVWEAPLGEMLWGFLFDAIHHRGQLSTYIRPMGGKVPSIYGPSADDPGM
ncbi:MAG: DinB family protein [Thermoanaerobaculia bacterium]